MHTRREQPAPRVSRENDSCAVGMAQTAQFPVAHHVGLALCLSGAQTDIHNPLAQPLNLGALLQPWCLRLARVYRISRVPSTLGISRMTKRVCSRAVARRD